LVEELKNIDPEDLFDLLFDENVDPSAFKKVLV
jgi:hypothetical protein